MVLHERYEYEKMMIMMIPHPQACNSQINLFTVFNLIHRNTHEMDIISHGDKTVSQIWNDLTQMLHFRRVRRRNKKKLMYFKAFCIVAWTKKLPTRCSHRYSRKKVRCPVFLFEAFVLVFFRKGEFTRQKKRDFFP